MVDNNFTLNKLAEQVSEYLRLSNMPDIKFTKNGYELRTKILDIAKDVVQFEYKTKLGQMEITAQRDAQTGEMVHGVTLPPVPGVDRVLEAAERFNAFINASGKRTSN
jgi:hypothetical protein